MLAMKIISFSFWGTSWYIFLYIYFNFCILFYL